MRWKLPVVVTRCRGEGGVMADLQLPGPSNRMLGGVLPVMGSPEKGGRGGCSGGRIGEGERRVQF